MPAKRRCEKRAGMKAYYLVFDGDPAPHLEPLRLFDPRLSVLTIASHLHCVSFERNVLESSIVNALIPHPMPHTASVHLLPAHLPIYPMPTAEIARLLSQMIAQGYEDDCAAF